jgi:hypothetical protein
MRFAPVCPIHIYEALAKLGNQYIGDYFLLLAHDVLDPKNSERYAKFFQADFEHITGHVPEIIMDNSVIELGSSVSAETLIAAAKIVRADVIAIPDVLEDGVGTVHAADTFMREWLQTQRGSMPQLMFVPQGKNVADFCACFEHVMKKWREHIRWVGIPRNLTHRVFPTRRIPVGYVASYFDAYKLPVNIHMMGFSDYTADDISTCREYADIISGIDSAVPLRCTELITEVDKFPDVPPRGNWWEVAQPTGMMATNVLRARIILGERNDMLTK